MLYARSILDPSVTFVDDDGDDEERRERYLTPSDRRTMGLAFSVASTRRSPSSRQDSMSVHFAEAGDDARKDDARQALEIDAAVFFRRFCRLIAGSEGTSW